jgi:hypothetical protein
VEAAHVIVLTQAHSDPDADALGGTLPRDA